MISTNTLKPGLLVSLKTSYRGNVNYRKVDLDATYDDKTAKTVWETTRTIADVQEFEAAKKAQSKASALIRGACTVSAFGLMCPEDKAETLNAAICEARAVVDQFNSQAKLSRVNVYVMVGRIAADDVEAIRAINNEMRELLEAMSRGVENLDANAIRIAANKASQLRTMLSPEAESRMKAAIGTARRAARRIVKAGTQAAIEVDKYAAKMISEQRSAFIDLSDEREAIARPQADVPAIDLPDFNGRA